MVNSWLQGRLRRIINVSKPSLTTLNFCRIFKIYFLKCVFSRQQFRLWQCHNERIKTSTSAYFIHKDELPFQYTVGELSKRLGAYLSRPYEIRRGDSEGEILG